MNLHTNKEDFVEAMEAFKSIGFLFEDIDE